MKRFKTKFSKGSVHECHVSDSVFRLDEEI